MVMVKRTGQIHQTVVKRVMNRAQNGKARRERTAAGGPRCSRATGLIFEDLKVVDCDK